MATFVDSAVNAQAFRAAVSIDVPAGAASGDVAVLFLDRWNDSNSFPVPSGPAGAVLRGMQVANLSDDWIQTDVFLIYIDGQTTLEFTWSGDRWTSLGGLFFTDVDEGLDLSAVPIDFATATSTATPPAVTVATVSDAALAYDDSTSAESTSSSTTHQPPTGYTEAYDLRTDSAAWRISPGDGDQTASGASVSASQPVIITALVAVAPESTGTPAIVAAVPAVAAAVTPTPTPTAGSTLASVPAVASAVAPTPTLRAKATVAAVPAVVTAVAPAPIIRAGSSIAATVQAVPAVAAGVAPAPTVKAASTLAAPPSVATSVAPPPTLTAGVTLAAPIARAVAVMPAPLVFTGARVNLAALDLEGTAVVVDLEGTAVPRQLTGTATAHQLHGSSQT